MIVSTSKK
jgi:hypothetical protein